jgi:hypothetical protein
MLFFDFIEHFWMLGLDSAQVVDRDFAKYILRRILGEEGWQLGNSKVGGGRRRPSRLALGNGCCI